MSSSFVGRRRELDELRAALPPLLAGRGSLFLLSGEPGIGKTRLAEEFATEATAAGVRVLWGRCHEAEGRPPYWPWAQLVRAAAASGARAGQSESPASRAVDDAVAAYAADPDAAPLIELIPELRSFQAGRPAEAPGADAATARFRVFQAFTSLLRRLAAAGPCLLILDDVHWADLPSLRILEFLAHELPDAPIAVVVTFREVEVRQSPVVSDLVGRLGRRGARLALGGLSVDEVSRFVARAVGEAVPATAAEWLHSSTEGNPFFLDEIVRLHRGEEAWLHARPSAPGRSDSVQTAIRQRLSPLPPDTLRVLAVAAVAGREFDLSLLSAAMGDDRATLAELLAPAVEIELLNAVADKPARYRFRHALVRETIYERLAPGARAERHRVYGELLERRYADVIEPWLPELAHHFYEASVFGDDPRALDYAERAGRHALRLFAYEEAVQMFERALHLVESGTDADQRRTCALLLDLGEATSRAGQREATDILHRAAALARRIGASDLLARAATELCDVGTAWAEVGRRDEALVGILHEALDALPESASALRARVMARLATELFWARPPEESERLSRTAVELARSADDAHSTAYALLARINCLSHVDHAATRADMTEEILALTGGRGELAANAWMWRLGGVLHLDRILEVRAAREGMVRVVQELRRPGGLWLVHSASAQKALIEGRFDEAERAAGAMLEQPTVESNVEQTATAALFLVRREQGRHHELALALEAFDSQQPAVSAWRASLAMLWADGGDRERALAILDAMTADGLAGMIRDSSWLYSVCCLAEVCGAYGTPAQAELLRAALAPYETRNAMAGPMYYLAPVTYYLGLLARRVGQWDVAAERLDAALVQARRLGARPAAARILVARAELIERAVAAGHDGAGDLAAAGKLRAEALEIAEAVGMDAVAAAARRPLDVAVDGAPAPASASFESSSPVRASLTFEADDCVIGYRGRTLRVRSVLGLRYLARLLAEPGRELHVLDLAGAGAIGELRDDVRVDGDLGPLLDPKAKSEMAERLADLRDILEEAERHHDSARAEAARSEIEALADHVASAVGLGGRDRVQGRNSERARAAVTKALRAAIGRIGRADAELGDLLARSVKTGAFCSYEPIGALALAWDVTTEPR